MERRSLLVVSCWNADSTSDDTERTTGLNYFRIGKLTWVLDVVAQICSDSSVNLYQTPRSDNSEHITLHSQSYFHHTRHRETSTDERVMACIIIFNYKAYHFQ